MDSVAKFSEVLKADLEARLETYLRAISDSSLDEKEIRVMQGKIQAIGESLQNLKETTKKARLGLEDDDE